MSGEKKLRVANQKFTPYCKILDKQGACVGLHDSQWCGKSTSFRSSRFEIFFYELPLPADFIGFQ